jgi:hypothetical protein
MAESPLAWPTITSAGTDGLKLHAIASSYRSTTARQHPEQPATALGSRPQRYGSPTSGLLRILFFNTKSI